MLKKTSRTAAIGLALLGAAPGVGTASYLMNPAPAQCHSACIPSTDAICYANGVTLVNFYLSVWDD